MPQPAINKQTYKSKHTGQTYDSKAKALQADAEYEKQQRLQKRYHEKELEYMDNNPIINYTIPFIPSKQITLTNAGSLTGATFSTNLLDSIDVNAQRAGLDLKTAIGIAAKESTLGNPTHSLKERAKLSEGAREALEEGKYEFGEDYNEFYQQKGNRDLDERSVISYNNTSNPYREAMNYAMTKSWSDEKDTHDYDVYLDLLEKGEAYADNQARKRLAQPKRSVLEEGFRFYKQNPRGYNPGQRNYVELVNKKAEEAWRSPQIQQWLKTRKTK